MAELIDLAAYKVARNLGPPQDRAAITFQLLNGPITEEVLTALETLDDAELTAFFRARARAKFARVLQTKRKPDDDKKPPEAV